VKRQDAEHTAVGRRPTIGFLIDWTEHPYQFSILEGVAACAAEHDVNLICFEGGTLYCPLYVTGGDSLNVPFDLAGPETVDGIIVLAAPIGRYCTRNQLEEFCAKYQPLPTVTIGFEAEGVPSLVLDNETGFVALLEHLIHEHHYQRFAFVGGPETNVDATARFGIFQRTLEAHRIPVDPKLVCEGDFMPESGARAVAELLDERRTEFDVLVAANDHMAIGAMRELSRRGIGVPTDVAVTGFDDLDLSSTCDPPLTTVAQPLYEQGRTACQMVLDLMAKRPVALRHVVPTRLVVRDSCWFQCSVTPRTRTRLTPSDAPQPSFLRVKAACRAAVDELLWDRCSDRERLLVQQTASQLLEAVEEGLRNGMTDAVVRPVRRVVGEYLALPETGVAFGELVSMLRHAALPMLSDPTLRATAEEVLYQAILSYAKKSWQSAGSRYEHLITLERDLTHFRTNLSLSLDASDQLDIIATGLPTLGVVRCLVFLYAGAPDNPHGKARLLLAFDEKGRKEIDSSAVLELPGGLRDAAAIVNSARLTYIVEPLGDVGFLMLQMSHRHGMGVYTAIRDTISFALRSSILLQQVQAQTDSLATNLQRLRQAMEGFIETMGVILETRDPYTAGHQRRVSDLARRIGEKMGLPANQVDLIRLAGLVHDIGKIAVPSEILNKPGRLQQLEFGLIKTHTAVAYDVLSKVDFPWPIADIVHQHHERLDGSGYPQGIAGDKVRIEARILAVADVVEAMASHRPYRPALGLHRALGEISEHRGVRYDSEVVEVCLKLFQEEGYRLLGDEASE